jgi:hypothetical protein
VSLGLALLNNHILRSGPIIPARAHDPVELQSQQKKLPKDAGVPPLGVDGYFVDEILYPDM